MTNASTASADSDTTLDRITGERWDAIIIGAGMGGATLGYALARAGWRVLFVDKGGAAGVLSRRGQFAESYFSEPAMPSPHHAPVLRQAGRWHDVVVDGSAAQPRRFVPFVGAGAGGSSALFGMALERFYPQDFAPWQNFSQDHGAHLVANWPLSYAELRPYYRAAEALYRVRGELDPLRGGHLDELVGSGPLTESGESLRGLLRSAGLSPYRLPLACEQLPDCGCCQGYLCPRPCKNDAERICVTPAVTRWGATFLSDCRVIRLEARGRLVEGVICRHAKKSLRLQSRMVMLAAGALATPAILLDSASSAWPTGLANGSGLVGRYLMRHYIDLYAISPGHAAGTTQPDFNSHARCFEGDRQNEGWPGSTKELAFNDFYDGKLGKLGTVQSFGKLPPLPVLLTEMEHGLNESSARCLTPLFRLLKPVLRSALRSRLGAKTILASLVEDLPYPHNAVRSAAAQNELTIHYRLSPFEKRRIATMRRALLTALKPLKPLLIKQAHNNQRIAHACGTCRFGDDPTTSVLDRNNRCHELDNLYIVDSSFFPSSAGINPALTIAANALRVAAHLTGREVA